MTTIKSSITDKLNLTTEEYQNSIENRKKTAIHLDAASKYHLEAAKHKEVGDYEKAIQSTINSKKELRLASEAIVEAVYGKAPKNESIIYQPF